MEKKGLEPAKTAQLENEVQYQQGSIVSRTLINKPTGTVTLFAFDEGQSLSEHTAPFDALVQVLDGKVRLTIGGNPVDAGKGDVVLMPANIPHAVDAVMQFKMLLTMIK